LTDVVLELSLAFKSDMPAMNCGQDCDRRPKAGGVFAIRATDQFTNEIADGAIINTYNKRELLTGPTANTGSAAVSAESCAKNPEIISSQSKTSCDTG